MYTFDVDDDGKTIFEINAIISPTLREVALTLPLKSRAIVK